MTTRLHRQYKALGNELIYALADNLEESGQIIDNEESGIYRTLKLPNKMSIRFLQWRKNPYPYYIILFDEKNKYVFELDLSMLVRNEELYSWNLKVPSNDKNKALLSGFLGEKQPFSNSYCAQVKQIKGELDAGVKVDNNGYVFLNDVSWNELIDNFIILINKAINVHAHFKKSKDIFTRKQDEDIDSSALEGNPKFITHMARERNRGIVEKKKRSILSQGKKLECEVCSFDFKKMYGQIGEDFCEVHHLIPLNQTVGGVKTQLDDLAIVCANCHRMLHRGRDLLTLCDLKKLMNDVRLDK